MSTEPGSDEIPGDQTAKSEPATAETLEQQKDLGAVTAPEVDFGPIINTTPPADLDAKVAEIVEPKDLGDVVREAQAKKRNFGWALAQMRYGARLRRNDWPAEHFHIYYREGFSNPSPDLCQDQIMLVRGQNHVVWLNGAATSADLLANDWVVVDA